MKNTVTEMNNPLEGIEIRLVNTEEQINDMEDKIVESPNQNSKMKRNF